MRKRLTLLLATLVIVAATSGIYIWQTSVKDTLRERAVAAVVHAFGERLRNVPLLAEQTMAAASMAENYGGLVSAALLATWQADLQEAPGRLTSSPWPEHIEIAYVDQLTPARYMVSGDIIEITSTELESSGIAGSRPIVLSVEKKGGQWQITHVVLGAYESGSR